MKRYMKRLYLKIKMKGRLKNNEQDIKWKIGQDIILL